MNQARSALPSSAAFALNCVAPDCGVTVQDGLELVAVEPIEGARHRGDMSSS